MNSLRFARHLLLGAALTCSASMVCAGERSGLLDDPSRGPLIKCYEQGFKTAIIAIKSMSVSPAHYLTRMAMAGGPIALSQRVRDVCDDWYRAEQSIPSDGKEDNMKAWGLLFSTFALAEHKDFLNTCLTYVRQDGDPDVASLCRIVSQ